MKPELTYLALAAAFTGLLWVPYVLSRIISGGLMDAVGYPTNPTPEAPWAQRMKKAHANAVENLVVFATLVLAASAMGVSTPAIATASMVYFWARVVHVAAFTFAIPWVRTLAFVVGFTAQAVVAWEILAR